MSIAARNAILAGGGSQPSGGYWGLCFTAEEPNCVVNMGKTGTPPAVTLETSPDGMTWTSFDADGGTTPITLAAVGDKVYFRAGSGGNTAFASSALAYRQFTLSGACSASGNIMSILADDESLSVISVAYALFRLFRNCSTLTSAPELPAVTLSGSRIYAQLFEGCTSLKYISVGFREWPALQITQYWVRNVSNSGTFRCPTALGTDATITRGASACPEGWTVINTDA